MGWKAGAALIKYCLSVLDQCHQVIMFLPFLWMLWIVWNQPTRSAASQYFTLMSPGGSSPNLLMCENESGSGMHWSSSSHLARQPRGTSPLVTLDRVVRRNDDLISLSSFDGPLTSNNNLVSNYYNVQVARINRLFIGINNIQLGESSSSP